MKINPTGRPNYIQGNYRADKAGLYKSAQNQMRRDEAELSEEAVSFSKVFSEAKGALGAVSAEETARIAKLKEQVAAGTYRVDSEAIAESILGDLYG